MKSNNSKSNVKTITPTARRVAARGYALPLELICKVTGQVVHYTDPKYIANRIAAAGSLNRLRKNFISRAGKSKLARQAAKAA